MNVPTKHGGSSFSKVFFECFPKARFSRGLHLRIDVKHIQNHQDVLAEVPEVRLPDLGADVPQAGESLVALSV